MGSGPFETTRWTLGMTLGRDRTAVGWGVWMVVRFVCVIRVPVCPVCVPAPPVSFYRK